MPKETALIKLTTSTPRIPVQGLFRKRSCRPVHIKSWTIMLNKNGFVRCHLQHCRYIAYSIDAMREHFKTCRGEVTANFACLMCGGQTTTKEALDYHKQNYHKDCDKMSVIKPTLNEQQVTSWLTDIKTRGYTQCLMPECCFISHKITELKSHYEMCLGKDPDTSLKFICRHCKGYTSSQRALRFHQKNHHKDLLFQIKQDNNEDLDVENQIKSYSVGQYDHPTSSVINAASKVVTHSQCRIQEDLADTESVCSEAYVNNPTDAQIQLWTLGLKNGYTFCNQNSCKYMSFDVDDMNDHFATCYEPYLKDEYECPICGGRTTSSDKLRTHLLHHHDEGYKHFTQECGFKLVKTKDSLGLLPENKQSVKCKNKKVEDEKKDNVKRKSNNLTYRYLTKWRDELLSNKFISKQRYQYTKNINALKSVKNSVKKITCFSNYKQSTRVKSPVIKLKEDNIPKGAFTLKPKLGEFYADCVDSSILLVSWTKTVYAEVLNMSHKPRIYGNGIWYRHPYEATYQESFRPIRSEGLYHIIRRVQRNPPVQEKRVTSGPGFLYKPRRIKGPYRQKIL